MPTVPPRLGEDLDARNYRVTALADGVDPQDAATIAQLSAATPAAGFRWQNQEDAGAFVYVGYKHADGRWFIRRRTVASGVWLGASGGSGYAAAWTGRAGLTYA